MYDRLGVTLTDDDFCGESVYNDRLGAVVDELDRLGLLRDSDGATCACSRPGSPAGTANRCR